MTECRSNASAAGAAAAVRTNISEAMFMSILLVHEKTLRKIKDSLEKLEGMKNLNRSDVQQ